MVIDIQERLVPAMKRGADVVEKANTLLAIANGLDVPIIVTEQYPKGLGKTVEALCILLEGAQIIEKISFSAYTTELAAVLETAGRKKIIVTGMETHVCVFQTVRDLLTHGYQVFVVRDGVCSRTEENHINGLELMSGMGATVTNTESVFFDLMKTAGTPLFKKLSKLIKQ